jgi:N-acetyl-anhydromuramyl-L-alanine amidase AmpD
MSLVACASEPTTAVLDLPGARNEAFRAAAQRHGIGEDWLVAIGFQQGRFEVAEADNLDAPPQDEDPTEVLAEDTPLDDTNDPPTTDDGAPLGDHATMPQAWGVMYLSDAQVEQAAQLTGHAADEIRTDVAANIEGATAVLADLWQQHGKTKDGLRAATTAFLGLTDDPEAGELALTDLDGVIDDGFDLTTADGERLAMTGISPDPEVAAAWAPGKYPTRHWIASPNWSSRQGLDVRYIVVHDIEGTMAGAIAVFKKSSSEASAHYIMRARDGWVTQMVTEDHNAWHVGHGWFNRHSIGIEHEGFANRVNGGGYYTDKQYQASARLACAIAHRYNIPVDRKHIFGHFNVPSILSSHTLCSDARGIAGRCGGIDHHSDPGRYWNWTKYMSLVRACVNAA